MTTASYESVCIWQLVPEIKFLLKVDITQDVFEEDEEGGNQIMTETDAPIPKPVLACLDNDGLSLYVYTGKILKLKYFEIDLEASKESDMAT
jgi:hypothetical protein